VRGAKAMVLMKKYKDIRNALAAHPTSWKLMDDVDDEKVIPQFSAPVMRGRKERGSDHVKGRTAEGATGKFLRPSLCCCTQLLHRRF